MRPAPGLPVRGATARCILAKADERQALKPHHALARLACAEGFLSQRRSGVDQRLAAALDLDAALDVLKRQQGSDRRMGERALDESRGTGPARRVRLETGIGAVAEEAGDGDV